MVSTPELAVSRSVARDEIRDLAARYAVAVDSRDLDRLVALFVPDVRVGADRTGRDALRESFDGQLRRVGRTFLCVGTHVIDVVDEDEATGTVYCRGEIQDGDRWIHQAIVYFDRYRRHEGEWLFVGRRHELFYGAEVGVNPLTLDPADWPADHDGLGTRPDAWESWQRFWDPTDD